MRRRIEEELKSLESHTWAGTYCLGNGLSENDTLIVAPSSNFFIEARGCLGIYEQNYGKVTYASDQLNLRFETPNGKERFADSYRLVRWGQRHYLIAENETIDFCNAVNSGFEPRGGPIGDFFLRQQDWTLTSEGKPTIENRYRRYLLSAPILAEIIEVRRSRIETAHNRKYRISVVRLNAGSRMGVLPEMKFYACGGDQLMSSLDVVSVQKDSADAELLQNLTVREPPPSIGWKVSTMHPANAAPMTGIGENK